MIDFARLLPPLAQALKKKGELVSLRSIDMSLLPVSEGGRMSVEVLVGLYKALLFHRPMCFEDILLPSWLRERTLRGFRDYFPAFRWSDNPKNETQEERKARVEKQNPRRLTFVFRG